MARPSKKLPDQVAVEFEQAERPVQPRSNGARQVKWTALGERRGAHSEHGKHLAGDLVRTAHADRLIERGFAVEA